jgi:multidrug transporter EmrE-like cation transporter
MTIPNTLPILVAVAAATLIGDYFIKTAALSQAGIHNPRLAIGAVIYGLTAIGWFFLMRSHSLAMVAIIFTAMTTVVLAGMGYYLFDEGFRARDGIGLALSVLALTVMYKG